MPVAVAEPKVWNDFPAKFSPEVIDQIRSFLDQYAEPKSGKKVKVLDPFAGPGGIHALPQDRYATVGIDIEPEAVNMHKQNQLGDATALPPRWTGRYDAIATSPTYANRMADHHDAQERCKVCKGEGTVPVFEEHDFPVIPCVKCEGTGRRKYKRHTYKHTLGRELHPNNSGGMQWGPKYRKLHEDAWAEAWRVLRPGGVLILNVSDHVRKHGMVPVTKWHVVTIKKLGFVEVKRKRVKTKRMGHGQSRDARAEFESVIVFQKPLAA